MIAAMIFLPVKDGMAKILGGVYPPLQIIWAQFCIVYLVLAPFIALRYGAGTLWPRPLGLQFLRGVFTLGGIGFFYWAVRSIPLASTTSIYFLAPLVVTALSPWVLKERIDLRRWVAVVVGFLGVTLILRPDMQEFNQGYAIAFVGGISIGLFYISNRRLADGGPAIVMLAHSVLIGAVLTSFAVPFIWVPPRTADVPLIAAFILCALVGQGLLMAAFKNAPASIVAPFQYSAIISATLFGFIVLGEFPDWMTIAGIAVVVASGVYIALREGRMKRGAVSASAPLHVPSAQREISSP